MIIKIDDILELINNSFKSHYFNDIKTHGVAELISQNKDEKSKPSTYEGSGNYRLLQGDESGVVVYHRILSLNSEEDFESGFGRSGLTIDKYNIKAVFFGQKSVVANDCKDIELNLAKEFKKLVPRTLDLDVTNRITVSSINHNKESVAKEEGLSFNSDTFIFSLSLEVVLKNINNCISLKCN